MNPETEKPRIEIGKVYTLKAEKWVNPRRVRVTRRYVAPILPQYTPVVTIFFHCFDPPFLKAQRNLTLSQFHEALNRAAEVTQ